MEHPTFKILGLVDAPIWPAVAELAAAIQSNRDNQKFEINYGFDPTYTLAAKNA